MITVKDAKFTIKGSSKTEIVACIEGWIEFLQHCGYDASEVGAIFVEVLNAVYNREDGNNDSDL